MKRRILAALLAAAMVFLLLPSAAFAAGDITVSINGGTAQTAASLEAAITASGVPLTGITSLVFTGGEVEAEDWAYIQNEGVYGILTAKLTSLTTLTVTDGATAVADLPDCLFLTDGSIDSPVPIEQAYIARVTAIGGSAFKLCTKLTTASFPAATSIGTDAFMSCSALTTASFPVATSIGWDAFNGCYALTTASFPVATSIGWAAFYGCEALTTASFPKAAGISWRMFQDCKALTTASFPAATSIADNAFDGCEALTSLSLPAAPPTVNNANAFNRCPTTRSLTLVNASGAALTGQALNNAITAYENHAGYDAATNKWYGWSLPARAVAPTIATQPAAQSATEGDPATFTVQATGNPTPTYQWQYRTSASGTWANVSGGSGATSTSYTTDATTTSMNGWQYRCVVSNGVSPNAESNAAALTVTIPTIPITLTPAATFAQGSAPGNLTLHIGSAGSAPNTAADFGSLEIGPNGTNFATVDPNDYTLRYGSIHITLNQGWLNTLAPGAYTLRVNLAGAYAGIQLTTRLIVTAPAPIPETGDGSMPLLWAGLLVLAAGGLIALRRRRKA